MTTTGPTDHVAIEAIVAGVFASAERGDWDAFRAAFADDARIRQNVGTDQSIDEAMVTLPRLTADGTTLRYENPRRAIADRTVTEIHDAVFTKPNGKVVRIDICVVVELNDQHKIVRVDEYLDSAAAAALFVP